jgi:hypothetical protein
MTCVVAGKFGRILLSAKRYQNLKGNENVQYVRMQRNNEKEHQEIKEE